MPELRLSFRFLAPLYHGRGDHGEAEWPPAPARAFQALVAAAARGSSCLEPQNVAALRWLERQDAPSVFAPDIVTGAGYRLSVPNNSMDVVAKAWCRGNDSNLGDANPATHRTMKSVRQVWIRDGDTVQFVWTLEDPVSDDTTSHVGAICSLAARVSVLGWGTDLVVGHGALARDNEPILRAAQRWLPSSSSVGGLRVPVVGTLDGLMRRFQGFQERLHSESLAAPPPFTAYRLVRYRRATDPPNRPVTVFTLLKPDATGCRPFDPVRGGVVVAGMARHATRLRAQQAGWDEGQINRVVLGHVEGSGTGCVGPRRFAYLPLPSLESRGASSGATVGSVRRLALASFDESCGPEHEWARRAMPGRKLVSQAGDVAALLSLVPTNDGIARRYLEPASAWATVTPVVLPGYDDPGHLRRRLQSPADAEAEKEILARLETRTDGLLRKAIRQAGFSAALAEHAVLGWRNVGFLAGTDLASRYRVPKHLQRFPRLHVQVKWRNEHGEQVMVAGPICFGGGRFFGLGLFAPVQDGEPDLA